MVVKPLQKNVKKQSKSGEPNLDFTKRNSPKEKVTVIDGSMIKISPLPG